jgi:hypothetical protein
MTKGILVSVACSPRRASWPLLRRMKDSKEMHLKNGVPRARVIEVSHPNHLVFLSSGAGAA